MAYVPVPDVSPGNFGKATWADIVKDDLADHETRVVSLEASGAGDVVGPAVSVEKEVALFDGTTGKLLERATGTGYAKLVSGVLQAPSATVPLATDVSGDLPLANLTPASGASKLLGRGDSGAGDYQEVTLGAGLAMTGTVLSSGGGSGDVVGPSSSVEKEIALFDGTTGKLLERATGTGFVKVASGVMGTPSATVALATEVSGNLPVTNLASGTGANVATYWRGDGSWATPSGGSGAVVQVVNTQTGAVATGTTTIPFDDTIPQNTEGTEFMTLAITPTSATNILRIEVEAFATTTTTPWISLALFQDSTAGALAATAGFVHLTTTGRPLALVHKMVAGTTSATTFKIRIGPSSAATVTFNGQSGGRIFGGVMASSITISEIVP